MIRGIDWLVTGMIALALTGIAVSLWYAAEIRGSHPTPCECICGDDP